jgi:molybdenum cofactor cytidylyltransferase
MARRTDVFVAGLVLAAGGSSRLGQPKQLLPLDGDTLLGRVMDTARKCRFDQLLVALGGAAAEVMAGVNLAGAEVVVNEEFGSGCSSSIAAGLAQLESRTDVLVLLLGDQPRVTPAAVQGLLDGMGAAPVAACAYANGRGHPLAFGRATFADLRSLHGDKAVWKLLDQRGDEVVDVPTPGPVPRDVDTWEDYRALVGAVTRRASSG